MEIVRNISLQIGSLVAGVVFEYRGKFYMTTSKLSEINAIDLESGNGVWLRLDAEVYPRKAKLIVE